MRRQVPYNSDSLAPPALRFTFDGDLNDSSGNNHGQDHFNPALSGPSDERWVAGRTGMEQSKSLLFDNDDFATLRSPFPAEDTEFSIAVWLAPRQVIFEGWHAFVGYQNGGVCPGRSPSMWVDGGGHGENQAGENRGLHFDSCEDECVLRAAHCRQEGHVIRR